MRAVHAVVAAGIRDAVPSTPRRVWNVVRLHAANPWPSLYLPWIVLLAVFALAYSIWRMVEAVASGPIADGAFAFNGGVSWILVYMLVAAVQAMNLTFRFALGMSVTRRDYYLGTAVYFVLLALMYGVGIASLGTLENATGGWGVGGGFFAIPGLVDGPWWQLAYVYVLAMLFFLFVGAAIATLYQRWKANGIIGFFLGLGILVVGAAWLVTAGHWWSNVGAFFVRSQAVGAATWSLVLTALAGVFGYLVLRRATPK